MPLCVGPGGATAVGVGEGVVAIWNLIWLLRINRDPDAIVLIFRTTGCVPVKLSSKSINVYIPEAYRSSNTEDEDIKPKFPEVNVVGEVEQRCCSVFFC
jgi:hypothetical protein